MDSILKWLAEYSPPIVLLIALSAAFIFVLKTITEKAVATQFDRYKKEIELRLQRRSNFEERILLDRYVLIRDLAARITSVATDLNRVRSGMTVPGLIREGDIVPLTEVFELLSVNRHLLTVRFYDILTAQAQALLHMANVTGDSIPADLGRAYGTAVEDLHRAMNDVFGIDRITWESH